MYTLLSTLSDAEVDYVLIGGLAVTLHGYQRVTMRSPEAMATVIDVLVRPVVPFQELKNNAVVKRIGPLSIPVAGIDDLIRLKTGTGRAKDVLDIEELEKIKRQRAGG